MERILILDFGGQYNQLIARRVRECHVYCEVHPYTMPLEEIRSFSPIGIIFTGGPNSVYEAGSPQVDPAIFELGIPVLGICYGCQLLAQVLGGQVTPAQEDSAREYGKTVTWYDRSCPIFQGLPEKSVSWMSHGDYMARVPAGFRLTAHSAACAHVAIADEVRRFYGVQFHPEVSHTEYGTRMLHNFLYEVCGARGTWSMADYKNTAIGQIREQVGQGRVLLALSGGVDSSVCAALLAEAIGDQLTCVFVDHGLMRLNEGNEVEAAFAKWSMNFVRVDAEERFLTKLAGESDPERKRKIIGAACPTMWISRRSSSPCACCSRTRCVNWAGNSACRSIWSAASRSPVPALPSGSSERSQRKKPIRCGRRILFSGMRSPGPARPGT